MNEQCDHTLHLTDQHGNPCGSWVDEQVGSRVRVVCRVCGRFYGYRPSKRDRRAADRDRKTRGD